MTKRRFIFGEEWLYIKIYSGPNILEEILINQLYPSLKYLYSSNMISKFFFVRYFDDGYHLRLRFRLSNSNNLSIVLNNLSEILRHFSDSRILSKTIIDVYNREIERYGSNSIEQIETIYSINSWEILDILKKEEDYENRWLYGIKIMDNLFEKFMLSTQMKYEIYQIYYLKYLKEFGDSNSNKEGLKKLYREKSKRIEEIIEKKYYPLFIPNTLKEANYDINFPINYILKLKENNLLEISFEKLLMSLLHMNFNRIFKIKPRHHEFVIYYMMSNFYKSQLLKMSKK